MENQNKVKQHNQNDNVKPNFQEFDQKKPYCQVKYKHSNIYFKFMINLTASVSKANMKSINRNPTSNLERRISVIRRADCFSHHGETKSFK